MQKVRLFPFFVRELRTALSRPGRAVAFVVAIAMHAAGHAALALAAAGVAVALAGGAGLVASGSTLVDRDALFGEASFLAWAGLGAVTAKVIGGTYASYVQARIAADVAATLRLGVLDRLLGVHRLRRPRQRDHGADDAGDVARRVAAMTAEVREVQVGLEVGVLGGVRAVVQLVALVAVLVALAPKPSLVAVAIFAPLSFLLGALRRRWKRASARASREGAALLEAADEAARHADMWVAYGAERKVRANVATIGEAIAARGARLAAGAAAMSGANEILAAVAIVCAVAATRAGWLGHVGSGSAMLAFAITFFLAYKPLRDLAEARIALTRASIAHDELHAASGDDERGGAHDDVAITQNVAIAHDGAIVDAAPPRAWALADLDVRMLVLARGASRTPLSFRVPAGSIVAIRGPSGAGKTTLLRTLLGLDAPVAGDVVYGDASLAHADAGPAARPFAWVPQDAPMLADTLAANVALGAPDDADVDPTDALALVGADHLVGAIGASRLGVGGRAVSGGERQWIAIARAIVTEQPVLLLDEPTSGMDAASQATVLAAIARLRGARSVVLVTHRPEPLAIADAVIEMVDGAGVHPAAPLEAGKPKGPVWTSS